MLVLMSKIALQINISLVNNNITDFFSLIYSIITSMPGFFYKLENWMLTSLD